MYRSALLSAVRHFERYCYPALYIVSSCQTHRSTLSTALRIAGICHTHRSALFTALRIARICHTHRSALFTVRCIDSQLPQLSASQENCPMPRAALLAACCIEGDSQTYPFAAPAAFCIAGNCAMPRSELLAALCVAGNCILQRSAPSTGLHTMEAVTRSTWQGDCRRVATACAHTTSLRSFSRCEAATCVCSSWVTHSGRTASIPDNHSSSVQHSGRTAALQRHS